MTPSVFGLVASRNEDLEECSWHQAVELAVGYLVWEAAAHGLVGVNRGSDYAQ